MLSRECKTRADAQAWMKSVSNASWIPVRNSATLLIDVDPSKFRGKTAVSVKLQATRVSDKRSHYSLFLFDQKGGGRVYFWGFMDSKQIKDLRPKAGYYELTHANVQFMEGNKRPAWMPALECCGLPDVQWRAPWVLTARKPTAVPDNESSSSDSEQEEGETTERKEEERGEAEAPSSEFVDAKEEEEEESIGKRRKKRRRDTATPDNDESSDVAAATVTLHPPAKRSRLKRMSDETKEEEEEEAKETAAATVLMETTTDDQEEQPTWEGIILPIAQKHAPDSAAAGQISLKRFRELIAEETGWTSEYISENKEAINAVLQVYITSLDPTEETDAASVPMAIDSSSSPLPESQQQQEAPVVVEESKGDGKDTKQQQSEDIMDTTTTVQESAVPLDDDEMDISGMISFDQDSKLLEELYFAEQQHQLSSSSSSSSSKEIKVVDSSRKQHPPAQRLPPKAPVKLNLVNYIGPNRDVEQGNKIPCPLYESPPAKNSGVTLTDISHALEMRLRVLQFKDYSTSDIEFMQFFTLSTPKARSLDEISFHLALSAMCTIAETEADKDVMIDTWFDLECRLFKERLQRKVRANPLKLLEQFSLQVKRPVLGISVGSCLYEYTPQGGLQPTGQCYPVDSPQYIKMKALDVEREDFERIRLRLGDICSEWMHETIMHAGVAYVPVSFLESRLRHLFKQDLINTVSSQQEAQRAKFVREGKKMPPGGTKDKRVRAFYDKWRAGIKKIVDESRPARVEDNRLAEHNMKAGIKELLQETYLKFEQRRTLLKWAIHIGMQDPVHWCMSKALTAMIRRKHGKDAHKEIVKKRNELVRFLPPRLRAIAKRQTIVASV
jgi:hypothetical protein